MRTLSGELGQHVQGLTGPRIYADANVPAGVVGFMRTHLRWDVLHVVEHDDLRRAADHVHFRLARQLQRTLVTIDRDYLDDRRFPPDESGGVLVIWAPNEQLLIRSLCLVDQQLFRSVPGAPATALPLERRKVIVDPDGIGGTD
jgi:hypothetical protein